jgi:hypothetical protein
MRERRLAAVLYVILLGATFGCGCSGESLPKTIRVGGRVTLKGRPLQDGTVTFSPVHVPTGGLSRPAIGALASEGTYRLSSFRKDDGVVPGEYAVTIESYRITRPTGPPGPRELDRRNRVSRIPTRYGDQSRSGLRATIPADARSAMKFDFELTD